MNRHFGQTPSPQASVHASRLVPAAQGIADADLDCIVAGAGLKVVLRQAAGGAVDPHTVPWAELTPADALAMDAELRIVERKPA